MAKYLITGSYTAQGAAGLLKDGGTKRRQIVEELVGGLGGKLESLYFAFGSDDVVVIVDMPDAAAMTAVSLTVGASGAINIRTTVLITPEEMDAAAKKTVSYSAPGA